MKSAELNGALYFVLALILICYCRSTATDTVNAAVPLLRGNEVSGLGRHQCDRAFSSTYKFFF
jgi:hypothetical protein